MAKYRVKAFYLHEHEHAAARQAEKNGIIKSAEWTEGYVIGIVDKQQIKALLDDGVVVSVIEEVAANPSIDINEAAMRSLSAESVSFREELRQPKAAGGNASRRKADRTRLVPRVRQKQSPEQKILTWDPRRTQF